MSGEIVQYQPQPPAPVSGREPRIGGLTRSDVQFVGELARTVVGTDFVKREIRGSVPAIIACALYGDALGLHPMVALQSIHMVDGKPTMDASLVSAKVRQGGHSLSWEEIHGDGQVVGYTVHGKRRDTGDEGSFTFTVKDAQRAGLVRQGSGWTKYPASMCWARAVTQLARMLFSDVFLGAVYTPEELGDDENEAGGGGARSHPAGGGSPVEEAAIAAPTPSPQQRAAGSGEPAVPPSAEEPRADGPTPDESVPADVRGEPPSSADDSAGVPTESTSNMAREAPADPVQGQRVAADAAQEPSSAPVPAPAPGERTYPGGEFKEHAKPWLLSDDAARLLLSECLVAPDFERWDRHRNDQNAAKNLVAEIDDPNVLRLLADHEARRKGRKGVLDAIGRRLEKIGSGGDADVGTPDAVEQQPAHESAPAVAAGAEEAVLAEAQAMVDAGDAEWEEPPSAQDNGFEPLPEALQAADGLVRLKALLYFVADQNIRTATPWTVESVLKGARDIGWKDAEGRPITSLEQLTDGQLAEVWKVTPADVRGHIEACSVDDVVALAEAL